MTDWKDEAFWLGWNNHDTVHGDCEWENCDVAFCKDFKPKERKAWREKRGLRMLTTPRKRAFGIKEAK